MEKLDYKKIIFGIVALASIILNVLFYIKMNNLSKKNEELGAFSQFGLPGIYHSSNVTIPNGEGAAFSIDRNGKLIVSPSSTVTLSN